MTCEHGPCLTPVNVHVHLINGPIMMLNALASICDVFEVPVLTEIDKPSHASSVARVWLTNNHKNTSVGCVAGGTKQRVAMATRRIDGMTESRLVVRVSVDALRVVPVRTATRVVPDEIFLGFAGEWP